MSETTTATAAPTTTAARFKLPSPQVALPLLAILGYTAFLITGFGVKLGTWQPLPIYIYLSLMLLSLQAVISENRSLPRIIYIFLTSGFAVVYAAEVFFNQSPNFVREPWTYIVMNALLIGVFIFDAVDRRRATPQGLSGSATSGRLGNIPPRTPSQMQPFSFGAFAIDFAGLAILFFIAYGLLNLLSAYNFAQTGEPPVHVVIDLHQTLGLSIPNIRTLPDLDLLIAIASTAVCLLMLGIVGVLATATNQSQSEHYNSSAVRSFGGSLAHVARVASNEVLLSLRLVLGPLVWLIPAFSIAVFSKQFTTYLNIAALRTDNIVNLFNPLSSSSQMGFENALLDLGLGIIAVAAVILAVAVVEHESAIISRTLEILGIAGRTVALTLALFMLSLAAVNAVVNIVTPIKNEPFQVGASTVLALLAGIGFALYAAIREQMAKQ